MKNLPCLSLALLLLLLPGCVTTPTGTKVDTDRVARIAGAAAYFGVSFDLTENPEHRAAYAVAVEALRGLEAEGNYDPIAFAEALRELKVREFSGPEGTLFVQAAVFLWDETLAIVAPMTRAELVQKVLPKVRDGIERALKAVEVEE